jgi:hypothetical protein
MRGAGTAGHTADFARGRSEKDAALRNEEAAKAMRTCALTDRPLDFSQPGSIATCPYGLLYDREAAIEALLRRKQQSGESSGGGAVLGGHVRGLKDLYAVRFETVLSSTGSLAPVCPVTGRELNGQVTAYALVWDGDAGGDDGVNVYSEKALKQMGEEAIAEEYAAGSKVKDKIRLIPPPDLLPDIKKALEEKRATEENSKKKKKKKRKHRENGDTSSKKSKSDSVHQETAVVK